MKKVGIPYHNKTEFYCPRCKVLSPQKWYKVLESDPFGKDLFVQEAILVNRAKAITTYNPEKDNNTKGKVATIRTKLEWDLDLCICQHCKQYSVWHNESMVYPFESSLPEPHDDMPLEVKNIYDEAVLVFKHSPRAAAALLRLAIETMIPLLDGYEIKKENLDSMIGKLVQKDIPEYIQQSLDVIRLYGNKGVHAGEIFLEDDQETVSFMFDLINDMIEELVTKKKKMKETYDKIPFNKIKAILKRDNR